MKSWQQFFTILSIVFLANCSSSQQITDTGDQPTAKVVDTGYEQVLAKDANQSNVMVEPNKDRKSNLSLEDMLRRLPGVQVTGSGPNARVKVQGSESFMAGTDPLFVLNGMALGTNYAQLHSHVNPNHITSLTVLKGADAAIYGTRAANGVILVRTKVK